MQRDALLAYLAEYLQVAKAPDYGPNGLQVAGREEIRRIVTGVSACVELFEAATERQADAVLVHHGILWDGLPLPIVGPLYRRLATLLAAELNLLAYHLPLDRHPEVGNNAIIARRLGLEGLEPLGEHGGQPLGWRGRFAAPIRLVELVARCRGLFARPPLVFDAGPDPIHTLGVVSGGAPKELYAAMHHRLDAFLTGEAAEWVQHLCREAAIHYLACGHHATERCGIRALGEHLASRFGLEVEFVDLPNPV